MGKRKGKVISISLNKVSQDALNIVAADYSGNNSKAISELLGAEMDRRGYVLTESETRRPREMAIEILVDGNPINIYPHNDEYFVAAVKGKTYEIKLRNNSPKKRLFVLSVDGINVVNGKGADFEGPGYVLLPWTSAVINGFLRDNEEAAAFKFSTVGQSYSKKTGHGKQNVGVIGCAVFDHKPEMAGSWIGGPISSSFKRQASAGFSTGSTVLSSNTSGGGEYSCDSINVVDYENSSFTSSAEPTKTVRQVDPNVLRARLGDTSKGGYKGGSKRRRSKGGSGQGQQVHDGAATMDWMGQDVGTEYGEKVRMRTQETTFDREGKPVSVLQLRYASKQALKSWGVLMKKSVKSPEAFPGEKPKVPEPPGWQG